MLQGAVFLLPFGVEEVLSDALKEGLSFGYRFKSLNDTFLGFWLQGVHLSQGRQAPERQPKEVRQGPGAPRGSSQGSISLLYQVLLLGISAVEHDIVKIFPEKKYILKVALSCANCLSGNDLREGNYWAFSHL